MISALWFITIMLLSLTLSWGSTKDPYRELWSSSTGRAEEPIIVGGNEIVPESDLRNPERRIWIITTGVIFSPLLYMTSFLFLGILSLFVLVPCELSPGLSLSLPFIHFPIR